MSQQDGGRFGREIRSYPAAYLMLGVLSFALACQATVLARIGVLGASPNLLLVVVVSWSLLRGIENGIVWGFVGGLGLDLIVGTPVGTSALAAMAVCFLVRPGQSTVFAGNLLLPIVIVALATPVYGWIVLLTFQLRGLPVDWLASTWRVIGPEILVNAALVVPVYPILRWLSGQFGATKMGW